MQTGRPSHPKDEARTSGRVRRRASLGTLVLVVAAVGCVAQQHTIEPYRSDPAAAAQIESRATEVCHAQRARDGLSSQPERPFRTDGCSAWPDSEATRGCCVEHDIAYWCGGSAEARAEADAAFEDCVATRSGSPWLGTLMKTGVRFGGHPIFPMPYRWGYGDAYRAGYPDLPEAPPSTDERTDRDASSAADDGR